jgi:ATP-dependent DNA helicase RecQ
MNVLIVAKTRRGGGACVGGITETGKSVRLIAPDAAHHERAGLEYEVGEVWEVEAMPDPDIIQPHVENIVVCRAKRLRDSNKVTDSISRFMPPVIGGPEQLFDGCARVTASGGLYICQDGGLPSRSTMFWTADKPLRLDFEAKRIRYRYPTSDGGRTLTFVGFQEPVPELAAGTLLRVSLAHWWRPKDQPDEELRCFVQLSGWFPCSSEPGAKPISVGTVRSIAPAKDKELGRDLRPQALELLKSTFGFAEFLPTQWEVIHRVLQPKDTLVIMPTGGGKSLCYQLPAFLRPGLTVVISPLVALMRDQVRQLGQVGVRAACLNHLVPLHQYESIMHQVRSGDIRLLYLAPETLLRPETLLLLEQSRLACLAIDEAHCISEWGHDFRPEYRQLMPLRSRFPAAVWIALTATATTRVREDIRRLLHIPPEGEFVASFNRKNLFVVAERRRDCLAQVLAFLQSRRGQSGIIYCGKRKQTDDLCADLNANGWPAVTYHAGMNGDERNQNQEMFINDEVPLVVATIAFGMGINKSDVRFVIHSHLPKDLESYYQEIGRAGRDGLPASCLLLYSRGDAVLHRRFIDQGAPSERTGRQARLEAMLQFAETRKCRRKPLLAYFGEVIEAECGHCDNCVRVAPQTQKIDRTPEAVLLLSCARLTDQIFGPEHLIQVLRGSRAEKIIRKGHQKLPVYAAGKEHSPQDWHNLVESLLDANLLERDRQFGSLRLTAKAFEVLNGKEKFLVSEEPGSIIAAPEFLEPPDTGLVQKLKALRKRLAYEARMPAFFIFSDRSLIDMARRLPQTPEQFLAVHGVGELKLENYGQQFLDVIRDHCPSTPELSSCNPEPKRLPGTRAEQIAKLFDEGQSIEQIAARYQILPATVVNHLQRFQQSGGILDPRKVLRESKLEPSEQQRVLQAFQQLGPLRLAPLYQALGATVPYTELHLLRLCWFCNSQLRHVTQGAGREGWPGPRIRHYADR